MGFDYGTVYWIPDKKKLLSIGEYKRRREKYADKEIWKVVLIGTPSQERFAPIRESLVRGCSAIAYVVDSADFGESALKIFKEVWSYFKEETPVVILANKQDLKGALKGKEVARRLGTDALVLKQL